MTSLYVETMAAPRPTTGATAAARGCRIKRVSNASRTLPASRVGGLWLSSLIIIAATAAAGVNLINRLLGAPVTETTAKHSLRVMTWNIGKLYIRGDSRAADNDLHYVAAVIRSVNPHVVALQEIRDQAQLNRLVAALGPGWRGHVPEDRWDRRAALVVRVHAHFHDLTTSVGRTAQGAVIEIPDSPPLSVASAHLDAFDAKRRQSQAEELVAGLQRLGKEETILAGDFNFDPAIAAQGSIDQDTYRFLTRGFVDAAKGAGATTFVHWRLDYVFYHSARVQTVSSRVLRDRRINIMDHDPLVVELRF
jgi:endonuclease/exonuclease/phosphatase family metal-dependent hydrolase